MVGEQRGRRAHRAGAGSGDEPPREALGRAAGALADDARRHEVVARDAKEPAQGTRQLGKLVAEILVREPLRLGAAAVVVDGGEHVEVAQQAVAKAIVGHGVGEQPVLDALGRARPVALGGCEQGAAKLLRARLDVDRAQCRSSPRAARPPGG